ncbi:MAG TPA: hypothetical protein VKE74_15290 [Gemmataceae bacterium]|nr:hypothetical protein [Gemmataceae bacterium]
MADGHPDAGFNGPVTLAIQSGPDGGVLPGTLTVNAVGGVATFTGLTILRSGKYTFVASGPDILAVVSGPVVVTPNAIQVSIAGRLFPRFPIIVNLEAVDATGLLASGFTGSFRVIVVKKPEGATVTGGLTGAFIGGKATLDLEVSKPGHYMFRVEAPNFLTAECSFTVRPRRRA